MAEQKNNHFVPVFYLKLWSNNGKQINSYLIEAKKSITATIRKETSKDYLYGKDRKVENVLAHLEDDVKIIIDKIINSKSIVELSDSNRMQLKGFMAVGAQRTQWQKDWYNFSVDATVKTLINHESIQINNDDLPDNWEDKVKIETNFPLIMKRILPYLLMSLEDLSLMLVRTKGETKEFIISDNPVVILNPFAEQLGFRGTGFSSAGLIIFMPICPNLALLAYDDNAYEINSNFINCDELNIIMAHNAVNNIYYKNLPISTIEDYLTKRTRINNNPEEIVINNEVYLRIGKDAVPCVLGNDIRIKSEIDLSQYARHELGAPNKYTYARKRSEGISKIFDEYEKYLVFIKEQCQKGGIPIQSVDTSFETFAKKVRV